MRQSLLLALLTACSSTSLPRGVGGPTSLGPAPMRTAPDAPFRSKPPAAGSITPFVLPEVQETKLSDGTRLWLLARHDMPIIETRVVSDRGAERADAVLATLYQRATLKSSAKTTMFEINERANALGASFAMHVYRDHTVATLGVLAPLAAPALEMFGELLQAPAFRDPALSQARTNTRTFIGNTLKSSSLRAEVAASALLFPEGHRFHKPVPEKIEVALVTPTDLASFHTYVFEPAHTTVVVVGDMEPTVVTKALEKTFVGRPASPLPEQPPLAAPPPPNATAVRFLREPGATQATILLSWVGPPRDHADEVALEIAGAFLRNRLYEVLRVEHGWTYGVGASRRLTRSAGPISVHTDVDMAHVGDALREIRRVLDELAVKAPSQTYLDDHRKREATHLAEAFSSEVETADTLASLAGAGRTIAWARGLDARLAAVTPEMVLRAAKQWLTVGRATLVVVGEQSAEKAIDKFLDTK